MNIYKTSHVAECPNGKLIDRYEIEIESKGMLSVEWIMEVLKRAPKQIYQEDLADFLSEKISGKITVTGWHYNVQIICIRTKEIVLK